MLEIQEKNIMKKLYKLILGTLALAVFLAPQVFAQENTNGIAPHYLGHYFHAKEVLQQKYPPFIPAFQTLQAEMTLIDSSSQTEQFNALMRFFPYLEKVAFMKSVPSERDSNGVRWDLQLEVVVTFGAIDMRTKDGQTTSLAHLLNDAFLMEVGGGDGRLLLAPDDIMHKHSINLQDAQRAFNVMKRLYNYASY